MIEQRGKVVEIEGEVVWVSYVRQTACQSCKSESVCGNSYLEKWASGKITHIPVLSNGLALELGEEVIVGIDERTVLTASMFVYALPILLLLAGCYAGHLISGHDLGVGLGGLLGIGGGFLAVYVHGLMNQHNPQFRPVVLKSVFNPVELEGARPQNVIVRSPN